MATVLIPTKAARGVQLGDGDLAWVFDATESEDYSVSYTVTDNPVENGRSVQDHVVKQSETVSFSGVITATPFNDEEAYTGRVADMVEKLEQLADAAVPFDVFGRIRTYESMVITGISVSHSFSMGLSVTVGVELKKVRIARFEETTIPAELLTSITIRQSTSLSEVLEGLNDPQIQRAREGLALALYEPVAKKRLEGILNSDDDYVRGGARSELNSKKETKSLLTEIDEGR